MDLPDEEGVFLKTVDASGITFKSLDATKSHSSSNEQSPSSMETRNVVACDTDGINFPEFDLNPETLNGCTECHVSHTGFTKKCSISDMTLRQYCIIRYFQQFFSNTLIVTARTARFVRPPRFSMHYSSRNKYTGYPLLLCVIMDTIFLSVIGWVRNDATCSEVEDKDSTGDIVPKVTARSSPLGTSE